MKPIFVEVCREEEEEGRKRESGRVEKELARGS